MNTYKAVSGYGKATYGEDVFEHEFTATDERDHVGGGHLELVPRTYLQLSNNFTAAVQGETFEAAFVVEQEAALIQGGHIERVDEKPKPTTTRKKN
jgi:hypothetical protein